MRVEDQDAQVGPCLDGLAQEQRDGRRLADAGGADHREVTRQRVLDGDVGLDRLVLRQRADGDALAAAEIVDGGEVAHADAVGDRADMRIGGDAAVEHRLAGALVVPHLAHQLDGDLDRVRPVFAPQPVGLVDFVDQADGPRLEQADRDHPADRPGVGDGRIAAVGIGGDPGPRAVALNDVTDDAAVVLRAVAALLGDRLAGRLFTVDEHHKPRP